jgi:hypothetical protein
MLMMQTAQQRQRRERTDRLNAPELSSSRAISIVNMFAFRLLTNDNSLRERTVSATGGPTSMAS